MWYHPEKEKKNMCLNTSLCVFLWGIVWEEYPQQTEEVISWPGVRCYCEPSNINVVATELGSSERETSTLNHWVVSTVPKEGSLCFYLQNAKFKGRSSWDTLRWCKREVLFFFCLISTHVNIIYILASFSTHLQYSDQILGFYSSSFPLPLKVSSFLMQDWVKKVNFSQLHINEWIWT